jgi:hypothetical protein
VLCYTSKVNAWFETGFGLKVLGSRIAGPGPLDKGINAEFFRSFRAVPDLPVI